MRLNATLHNDFFDGHVSEVLCRSAASLHMVRYLLMETSRVRLSLRDRDVVVSHMTGVSYSEVYNYCGRRVCDEMASNQLNTEEMARDGNEKMFVFLFQTKGFITLDAHASESS